MKIILLQRLSEKQITKWWWWWWCVCLCVCACTHMCVNDRLGKSVRELYGVTLMLCILIKVWVTQAYAVVKTQRMYI